jgi:hypothetical protein
VLNNCSQCHVNGSEVPPLERSHQNLLRFGHLELADDTDEIGHPLGIPAARPLLLLKPIECSLGIELGAVAHLHGNHDFFVGDQSRANG